MSELERDYDEVVGNCFFLSLGEERKQRGGKEERAKNSSRGGKEDAKS